jgi:hypothetical protein
LILLSAKNGKNIGFWQIILVIICQKREKYWFLADNSDEYARSIVQNELTMDDLFAK